MFKKSLIYLALFILIVFFPGCHTSQIENKGKVLLALPENEFSTTQFLIIKSSLENAGLQVQVATTDGKNASGTEELTVRPDLSFNQVMDSDFRAMVIIGGAGARELRSNGTLHGICANFIESGKLVGALELAPLVLAEAGLLEGETVSAWPSTDRDIVLSGGTRSLGHVTLSGNILTGIGGSDRNIFDFTKYFLGLLSGRSEKQIELNGSWDIPFTLDGKNNRFMMTHADHLRTGEIYVPASYSGDKEYSLIFGLHGTGGRGRDFRQFGFEGMAEEMNFIMVYPDGFNGDWNILPGIKTDFDDVGYFRELIEIFSSLYNIDSRRIYITGFSLGGFMSYRLAYDLSDSISAIAPASGLFYKPQGMGKSDLSVSILHQHAVNDFNVPYLGDPIYDNPMGVAEILAYWRSVSGVSDKPVKRLSRNGIETTKWQNTEGTTEISLIEHPSGGHGWLPGATEQISAFFYNTPSRANRIEFDRSLIDYYVDQGSTVIIDMMVNDPDNIKEINLFKNGDPFGVLTASPFTMEKLFEEKGDYRITGRVTLTNGEELAVSNSLEFTVTRPDLAGKAPASSSSVESELMGAFNLTDHITTTRWASEQNDSEWVQVDLESIQEISGVTINWEAAYARAYDIQISSDGENWTTVYSTEEGSGGTVEINFTPLNGRYVRMQGRLRGTRWGYSIWDMLVH